MPSVETLRKGIIRIVTQTPDDAMRPLVDTTATNGRVPEAKKKLYEGSLPLNRELIIGNRKRIPLPPKIY